MQNIFKIIAQTGQIFFVPAQKDLGLKITAARAQSGAGIVYLTINRIFTPIGDYQTQARAQEVADELENALKEWNAFEPTDGNPVSVLKKIMASNIYAMSED